VSREPPRNRLTRAQRVEQWNAAGAEARALRPRKAIERASKPNKARYAWLDAVMNSGKPKKGGLPATSRLIAHTLAFHGNSDGSKIFPSVRALANETGLSDRAVCEHLDHLVRRGFLMRKARGGHTAGSRGFEYVLTVPTRVLTEDQHQAQAVLTDDQHRVQC